MESMGMFFAALLVFLLVVVITAAILRWLFRINEIVALLKEIVRLLGGVTLVKK